jgi:ABC-type multidrug transport system ATPase subunit
MLPTTSHPPILETKSLGKRYGSKWAVRQLNLVVYPGDVFGFLGPNGAGKSTTLRMILSLIRPSTGEVQLFGRSLRSDRSQALRQVGGIVERPDFYNYLSAVRNLEIVGALYGGIPAKRISEVLELVGLGDRGRDSVKTYSHGMKQRLGIAQALLSDPTLVVLDEPTSGLDPQGMKDIRELIIHLARDKGKTIVLSSHLLSEIELVATRMAIINRGELKVQGDVHELMDRGEYSILIKGEPAARVASIARGRSRIVTSVEQTSEGVLITLDKKTVPSLTAAMIRAGVKIHAVIPRRSLESYFLSITEHSSEAQR